MAPLSSGVWCAVACLLASFLATPIVALPAKFDRTQVYKGLGIVTDMAFLPDGMVLLADFKGMIYIADPESSKNNAYELYMEIKDINTKGERGLVSIELDPDFATNSKSREAAIGGGGGRVQTGLGRSQIDTQRQMRQESKRERQSDQ